MCGATLTALDGNDMPAAMHRLAACLPASWQALAQQIQAL